MIHELILKLAPLALALCAAICMAGCAAPGAEAGGITRAPFGAANGQPVELFTLRNANGMEAKICNYGGILTSLKVPDRNGHFDNVALGYDYLDGYLTNSPYFGALIGRYGNRIANGKFTLNGVAYSLPVNNSPNCLHGGPHALDKDVWQARMIDSPTSPALELTLTSPDGDEGFPGTLKVKAVYTLTPDNSLRLDYTATTDKDTVVNLTQHSYFNLAGKGDVLGHVVMIDADRFTPTDETLIPTGELKPVAGTPFDFRRPISIGARINDDDEQLKRGIGYDHNFVLNHKMGSLDVIARVVEPASGRVLEELSTSPGVQFYTGNHLDGSITGTGGVVYAKRTGFCLEAQHFPDSPNHPEFPTTVLKPGQTYRNTIIYRFSTQ